MSKVQVTFSAPLIFLSSDQWSQIRTAISAQFPLRDILWNPSSRPSTQIIQELEVELVGLDTIRDEHTSQVPQNLLEKPFLNLYIVTCEDNDAYKNTVRKQIKDWHTNVSQRKNQEWLILLVVRPDARATAGGFFAMNRSVLDKIKADFNSDRKDRCVQLVWSQGTITPPACAELTTKMKDGVMSAFDSAVMQRSDEVKRSESQRQMPGWNFCTFFILKESLASSFVGMSLLEDAILTYSELEASFLQTQSSSFSGQKTISWFGKLINPDPNDDSLPLLDISKKPYRDLILNNTISVFDFRVYLLAKHCEVLGMSGRVGEMARKAAAFLGGFGRRLKESDAPLAEFFVESWIYSSALHIIGECDKWASYFELDASSTSSFNAVKGELYELARIQLDKVGIGVSHLPNTTPFSMSLSASDCSSSTPSTPTSPAKPSVGQITRPDLLAALTDRELFDKLYVDTTNRAIDMYVKGARRKFALRLHGSLAALDLDRLRYSQAHQTYTSLPAHYTPHSWTYLATFMLGRRLITHEHLSKPHNREWLETALAFLKGFVEEGFQEELNGQQLLGMADIREYVSGLVVAVKDCAKELDGEVIIVDHPVFTVQIKQELATYLENEDGSFVDVRVRNALPCAVVVNRIRILLSGRDSEQLEFSASEQTLLPGTSTVTLFCPNSTSGLFKLDTSEIFISSVRLQWNHQSHIRQAQRTSSRHTAALVRIPRDPGAVDIQVEPPRRIQLDAPQSVLVILRSGRNRIARGALRLTSPRGITFDTADAEFEDSGEASVEGTPECLALSGVGKESQIQIRVPHARYVSADPLKVTAELEYHTSESETSIARHVRFTRYVATSLPLMIQAHDHFRGKSLISKFTIATSPGTHQHLRVSSVKLQIVEDEQGGLDVKGCRSAKRGIVTVTPAQPANFLFRVDSETHRTGYGSMQLYIAYRLLREEIETLVTTHTSLALTSRSMSQYLTPKITQHILKVLENDATWLDRYNVTGELYVPQLCLENIPDIVDDTDATHLRVVINEAMESLRTSAVDNPNENNWREVIIPVDLPFKNIVSSAHIQIHAPTLSNDMIEGKRRHAPLLAGQPVAATLSISSSFHWRGPGTREDGSYPMRFDVKEVNKDWLISGRKKGDFTAGKDTVYSVPLTLIPLHHGEIPLPQVNVHPLAMPDEEMIPGSMNFPSVEAYQTHGAERVLVLPRGGRTTFVVGMGGE